MRRETLPNAWGDLSLRHGETVPKAWGEARDGGEAAARVQGTENRVQWKMLGERCCLTM
jgi:hypothetical protein